MRGVRLNVQPLKGELMSRHLWLACAVTAALGSGCVVRATPAPVAVSGEAYAGGDYATAYPTVPPPQPIVEYRPQPPGWGYAWVDGYWDWTGYDWSWNSGYWAPQRPGVVYVAPRYVFLEG